MTDGLPSIIKQLERQKAAVEKALAALRNLEVTAAPIQPAMPAKRRGRPAGGSKGPDGQRKLPILMKEAAVAAGELDAAAIRKTNLTPEGRQKLADSMKRRWALKRAAVKKGPKKAA